MPAGPLSMAVAFSARQQLRLSVNEHADHLRAYLKDERRVVEALLDPTQLEILGPGHYRYHVTRVQLFHLQIHPVVEIRARQHQGRLELDSLHCQLEGLGLVEDFQLKLNSWLLAGPTGLEGEAALAVSGRQPALLALIPQRLLEATGRSVLNGILANIRHRVSQQLVADFHQWCEAGHGEGPLAVPLSPG
jgi:hypothetical protein